MQPSKIFFFWLRKRRGASAARKGGVFGEAGTRRVPPQTTNKLAGPNGGQPLAGSDCRNHLFFSVLQ
jgi:hypothetical protein